MSPLQNRIAAVLFTTSAGAALAFQPLITDDTGTQGLGAKQVEVAYVTKQADLPGETTRTNALPLVFTWGAGGALDVYAGIVPTQIRSGAANMDAGGLSNTSLGAKWRFLEQTDNGTSLAIKPELRLPVGSTQEAAGLGAGMTSYGLTLILSQELPFGAVHVNLARGLDRFLDPEAHPNTSTLRVSVAPVLNVNDSWKLALEVGRESVSATGNATTSQFVQLAAIYSPNNDTDVAVGLLRTTDDAAVQTSTTTATLGVTWRFR